MLCIPASGSLCGAASGRFPGPLLLCQCSALVLGDEVLIGAVPMEDMDLGVNPPCSASKPIPAAPTWPTLGSEVALRLASTAQPQPQKSGPWDRLACEVVESWP